MTAPDGVLLDEPAHTIAGKGTAAWVLTGQNSRTSRRTGATRRTRRSTDAPAPTVTGQARSWRVEHDEEPPR